MCQPTLRCPGRRLPDRSVKGDEGGEENANLERRRRGCIFALIKATDFSNSLGKHIWILRAWQGHNVPIQYKDW